MEHNLRINVVGTSSTGKTTFCRKLSKILSIPHIEMDALFWGPNWSFSNDKDFFSKLRLALRESNWILDGNYSRTTFLKWENATTIIWLDFSFPRVLYQALKRAIGRIITREELWEGTGNKETLKSLFSKDSIVFWAIKSYRKIKIRYEGVLKSEVFSQIQFIRLRSPKEVELFLFSVKNNKELLYENKKLWKD